MYIKKLMFLSGTALAMIAVALFATNLWATAHEKVLHSFTHEFTDGNMPIAGLISDAAGNLYGTTSAGGPNNDGTVFELTPGQGGIWTEKVLHNFNEQDGRAPSAGLVLDGHGNLYGTTSKGGIGFSGTVFELSPGQGGVWTEKVLYEFGNGELGFHPCAGVIFDAAGNLYGTTSAGGYPGFSGTVFELSPGQGGRWTGRVLYHFHYNYYQTDGENPNAGVIFDAAGNLYGTTSAGGTYSAGTVFELSPGQGGNWTETVLLDFNGSDGSDPEYGSLIFDGAGNLYCTTSRGGAYGDGTAFELSPGHGGSWTERLLYSFCSQTNCADGSNPAGGLIFDNAGNLYGTTAHGGADGAGSAFELSPIQGGGWTEAVLHSFEHGAEGTYPQAGLIFDSAGNLYGTTNLGGGPYAAGTVFELSPGHGGGWTAAVLHNFSNASPDGVLPYGGLTFDGHGNLYGTTSSGGYGFGTVFELAPMNGNWTETVLYSFDYWADFGAANPYGGVIFDGQGNLYGTTHLGGLDSEGSVVELTPGQGGNWTYTQLYEFLHFDLPMDGAWPRGNLVFDAHGNLYGTAEGRGTYGYGMVFELTNSSWGWYETPLHSFNNNGTDGVWPEAGLIFDAAGNLYGTTIQGGTNNRGTVFELTPGQGGDWTETVLLDFNGTDGGSPWASLVFDGRGHLYGTTGSGGAYGFGTVFELTPTNGSWTETVLHNFKANGTDGTIPLGSLIFDAHGNLYGTTRQGGTYNLGTVFELTPEQGGNWTETVLFDFNGTDGANPWAGLVLDAAGNLYGTTYYGGAYNYGTVFEIEP
jgi:uncharacterized repeat protein (TIGR03803 family)